MKIKQGLLNAIESLPDDALADLKAFVTELKLRHAYDPKTGCLRLGGLFEAYGPITDADIAHARREMWGRFDEGAAPTESAEK
jgi:hypothetical protein